MADTPTGSETIADPVVEFKKGKAKREAKRKEVRVITEYVPPEPAAKEPKPEPAAKEPEPEPAAKEPEPEPEPVVAKESVPDVDSIASRVADLLFAKMAVEKVDMDKTPEIKTKAKPKQPPKKKEKPASPPPPTKYFGWC
jgi:hypothetical protein